jgi:hypothetical protein
MREPVKKFEPLYPDVLGAITGGTRISMDNLQCALGIYPRRTYINQPVEVVLILQNMVDQSMQVKVGLQLPTQDKKGDPVVIDTPKKIIALGLRPGEVGVLRVPIIPHPPTQAGSQYPVRVAVRYRTAAEGRPVRPPTGGAPPTVLSVSSMKLHALREVEFAAHTWNQSAEIITSYFDVAPKRIPPLDQDLQPIYESLWTHEEMAEEREMVQAKLPDAVRVAAGLTRASVLKPLVGIVEERFGEKGMPLHPGEALAIAKMVTYALDEGLELEPGFSLQGSRWFETLCQVLAHNEDVEDMARGDLVDQYLFDAALYDAILLAFAIITPKVKEDLGDHGERMSYATRILTWFAGQGQPDLSFVYLPLVLGGLVINLIVSNKEDNPWVMLDQLSEAERGRARLVSGEASAIFTLFDELMLQAEDALRRARVPRP